jgi:hypothetical protein
VRPSCGSQKYAAIQPTSTPRKNRGLRLRAIAWSLSRILTANAATIARMSVDAATLQEQLREIGAQLDWVRDYL